MLKFESNKKTVMIGLNQMQILFINLLAQYLQNKSFPKRSANAI